MEDILSHLFPTIVPCLCNPHDYDGGDFPTFPIRKGYKLNLGGEENLSTALTTSDDLPVPSGQACSLIQSWLFFRLLSEIMKIADVPSPQRILYGKLATINC